MGQRKRQPEQRETLADALGPLIWSLQEPVKPPLDKPVKEYTWQDVWTLIRHSAWMSGYDDAQFDVLVREVALEHGGKMGDERCAECQAEKMAICFCGNWEPIPQITEVYIPIRDESGKIIGTRREVRDESV